MHPTVPPGQSISVRRADLRLASDREAVLRLVDAYARDPMGVGKPLPEETLCRMVEGLREHPASLQFLARLGGQEVGLAVGFLGFSTFAAGKLLNVHDLIVDPNFRRLGVAKAILEHVAADARHAGCCKLTLEVRDDNPSAKSLHRQCGFRPGQPAYEFWTSPL